jgi:hypothetical protein
MALMPEFEGAPDAGWSIAGEALRTYDDFTALVKSLSVDNPARVRVTLAFYAHVAEGSGFYEIPRKLLRTLEGNGNNGIAFQSPAERHRVTGMSVAPDANLIGHATDLGLSDLAEVFRDAFDADIRDAVAHADYILWSDGMRLWRRNDGAPRVISWDEFDLLMNRGLNLFALIRQILDEYVRSYDPPKTIRCRLATNEPEADYTVYFDPETGAFGFTAGRHKPD